MAASAFLPELATQVVVPAAAVVGIAFAVVQWVLVSKVKMSPDQRRADGGSAAGKSGGAGASEYLIEEEEGLNEHNVVVKCAEIQNAISEGEGRVPGAGACFALGSDGDYYSCDHRIVAP
jgi:H+-translocating diphosphatase